MATVPQNSTPIYKTHPKHRNATPGASQWSISLAEEQSCYGLCCSEQWIFKGVSWGLHFGTAYASAAQPVTLGVDEIAGLQEHVKIAKFVSDQGITHGYPVAHWASTHDRPPVSVLEKWLACKHISKSVRSKIQRGKKSGM
jgi:hypothetical protein